MNIQEKFLEMNDIYEKITEKDFKQKALEIQDKMKKSMELTPKEEFLLSFLEKNSSLDDACQDYRKTYVHLKIFESNGHSVLVRFVKKSSEEKYKFDVLFDDFKKARLIKESNGKYKIEKNSFKKLDDVKKYTKELNTWVSIFKNINYYLDCLNSQY